jgi:hypothetical protein
MLHCTINQTLQTLTTGVHCFGEVTTSITPYDITLVRRKDKQAQMMVAGVPDQKLAAKATISTMFSSFKSTFLRPLPMAMNTNIPFVETIPLHVVLVFIDFTVFPVLTSTSWMRLSESDVTFNDRLYYTDPMRSEVVCCDINGTILWKFTDKSVLETPRGITVDDYGNVYVVCANPANVIVISPDNAISKMIATVH